MVKSTECSLRGCRLDSQHPQSDSQLSVTPIPGDQCPFLASSGHQAHRVQRHTCRQNTHTSKIKFKNMFWRDAGSEDGSDLNEWHDGLVLPIWQNLESPGRWVPWACLCGSISITLVDVGRTILIVVKPPVLWAGDPELLKMQKVSLSTSVCSWLSAFWLQM